MNEKMLSIIIPTYNMANELHHCLTSIWNQTSHAYEIVIVDDGSTDGTLDTAKALIGGRPHVKLLRQAHAGSGAARNLGIEHAVGDYLYFIDADDTLIPECVETILSEMRDGCDMLVFGFKTFSKEGILLQDEKCIEDEMTGTYLHMHFDEVFHTKRQMLGAPWNKVFLRSAVMRHAIRYPDLQRCQDEVFLMRYMHIVSRVRYIPRQLYIHLANSIVSKWEKFPLNYMDIAHQVLRYRIDIVFQWNTENMAVLASIAREFSAMCCDACVLVYAPKHHFSYTERMKRLSTIRSQYRAQFRKGACLYPARSEMYRRISSLPLPLLDLGIKRYIYHKRKSTKRNKEPI